MIYKKARLMQPHKPGPVIIRFANSQIFREYLPDVTYNNISVLFISLPAKVNYNGKFCKWRVIRRIVLEQALNRLLKWRTCYENANKIFVIYFDISAVF